jgi:hypothetical protein
MLRRISTLIASAAMVGLCAIPASASTSAAHGVNNFTAPGIKGHYNVVQGWGSYKKLNAVRVQVRMCVKQTGNAFAVGAEALVYNNAGKTKNIAGIILQGHKGQTACGTTTFLFYSAHLKVFTFVGNGGHIVAKSALKKIY